MYPRLPQKKNRGRQEGLPTADVPEGLQKRRADPDKIAKKADKRSSPNFHHCLPLY